MSDIEVRPVVNDDPVFFQTDAQQEARSYLSEEMLAGEYRRCSNALLWHQYWKRLCMWGLAVINHHTCRWNLPSTVISLSLSKWAPWVINPWAWTRSTKAQWCYSDSRGGTLQLFSLQTVAEAFLDLNCFLVSSRVQSRLRHVRHRRWRWHQHQGVGYRDEDAGPEPDKRGVGWDHRGGRWGRWATDNSASLVLKLCVMCTSDVVWCLETTATI